MYNSCFNHVEWKGLLSLQAVTYLWIVVIERLNGSLNLAAVDEILDVLSSADRLCFLLRWQVGFFGEVCSRVGIALHSKVVEN